MAAEPNHARLARAGIRKSTASCVHGDVPNRLTAEAARRRREVGWGGVEDPVSAVPASGAGSRASRLPGRSATVAGLSWTLHAPLSPPLLDVLDALVQEESSRQIRVVHEVLRGPEVGHTHRVDMPLAPILVSLR